MAAAAALDKGAGRVLLPILANQLVAEYHGLLRELAQTLPRGRGQPPKSSLAAAKVLSVEYPDAIQAALEFGRPSESGEAEIAEIAGARSAERIELDAETADIIVGAIQAIEEWLVNGRWCVAADTLDREPPRLLLMIEDVAGDRVAGGLTLPKVTDLIVTYRDLMAWGASFIEQRPRDQSGRDDLVLLTAVRMNLLHQPLVTQDPVHATMLLNREYGRLAAGWGEEDAIGVSTYSKGHFGNDQVLFNDVCRAMVVDLLFRAVAKRDNKPVYISTTIFDQSSGRLRAELDQKIRECLAAGRRVIHVLDRSGRVDDHAPGDDTSRQRVQADFATHMVADMETKGVYVPVRNAPPESTDMVLVEGVGAVVFPSVGHSSIERSRTGPPSPAMAVRCITGRGGSGDGPAATPIVAELRAEARALYGDLDQSYLDKRQLPFGHRIPTENLLWFDRQLTASELLEGDRFAMKVVIPTSTMPDELAEWQFEEWRRQLRIAFEEGPDPDGLARGWPQDVTDRCVGYLRRKGWIEIERATRRLQNKRSVRHFGFETNTSHNRYRDCVLRSKMDEYLTEEDPWYEPNPVYGPAGLTLEHRQEHMLYVVGELEKTRINFEAGNRIGYTLGLLDDQVGRPYDLERTWFLATGSTDQRADQVHYLHQPRGSAASFVATLTKGSLHDFEAVETFVSLFDGMWYSIPVEDRYPTSVIDYVLEHLPPSVRRRFKRPRPPSGSRSRGGI